MRFLFFRLQIYVIVKVGKAQPQSKLVGPVRVLGVIASMYALTYCIIFSDQYLLRKRLRRVIHSTFLSTIARMPLEVARK